jgi:hypothetical protein
MNRVFDSQKALEAMVFVAQRQHDLYASLKAIYFADKEHLRLFGRQMFDEQYAALEMGPTPSALYDYVKSARGEESVHFSQDLDAQICESLRASARTIRAMREPNLYYLSKSEIQCLEYGLSVVAGKSFDWIKEESHDAAYEKTRRNGIMELDDIVRTLPNAELILSYLSC